MVVEAAGFAAAFKIGKFAGDCNAAVQERDKIVLVGNSIF